MKKSKVLQGIGLGFLIGAGTGALLGCMIGGDPSASLLEPRTREEAVILFGTLFGFPGLILGGIFGLASAKDKTIQIEGRSPSTIEFYLDYLRKKAHIRDYK